MPIPTPQAKLDMIRLAPARDADVAAARALKPGDYEIGFQRTNDILDEALEVFQRSSRSSMGVAGDVMIALFTADGDLVNAAAGTYLHAIIQPIVIKYILEHYSENPGIRDGDIFYVNDALYGGIHNPDQVVVLPVFHDGELIAWAGAANHTTETGAIEPGGMPVSATSRFHEGMNMPPVKIGENHELRNDWVEVFNAFGIRAPQMIVTDLKARSTAADRVRTRIIEVVEKEGRDFLVGTMRRMLEVAEEGARRRIASWLDGRYKSVNFSDLVGSVPGLVRVELTLIKEGDEILLDFTGTSPENMSSYHAHVQAVVGHVANYVYSYLFFDLPISSATFAPLRWEIPQGTVLNPDPKAATSCSVMIGAVVMSACANAFAKLIFSSGHDWNRVTASASNAGNAMVIAGLSQWGLPFADMIAYSINTEGMGGRPGSAGMNAFGFPWCPFGRAPDVELMENEFPLLVPISQHWSDSPGAGKHRGGAGSVQLWVAHQTPQLFFLAIADNSKLQSAQPLWGGYGPATCPGIAVRGADLVKRLQAGTGPADLDFNALIEGGIEGTWELEFMGRSVRPFNEGDVATFGFSAGGAGYGDPLEADPEEVARDLFDGIVSPWTVERVYRVAIDPDSPIGEPLIDETERLRAEERRARSERGASWDEFHGDWVQLRPPEEILFAFGSWPEGVAQVPMMRM